MQTQAIKSFHRGLDRDTDIRLLQNGSYIDAMNIKISNALDGRVGVVSNMRGTKNLVDGIYTGLTGDSVLQIFSDRINNCLYAFIANSTTAIDRIAKYVPATNTWSLVAASSLLAFNPAYKINSFDVIEGSIFWNDNNQPPRKFDLGLDYLTTIGIVPYSNTIPYYIGNQVQSNGLVYNAIANGTGNAPSGNFTATAYWQIDQTQGYDESYFNAACLVPIKPPIIEITTDPDFAGNFIRGKFLQFKYRFVYTNNQRSVFSPISELAYSDQDYLSNIVIAPAQISNNKIVITIPNNNANKLVSKIEIVSRSGNTGDFSLVETINIDTPVVVINDSFDSDPSWTKDGGWSISGGKLTATAVAPFESAYLAGNAPLISGRTYTISYTILTYSSGSVAISSNAGTTVLSTRSSVGTFTETVVWTDASPTYFLIKAGAAGFNGIIDDVIVYEGTVNPYFIHGYTLDFYNNGVSTAIALAESNQIYDDQPRKAKAQRYSNNRMLYAGTLTGYDKPSILMATNAALRSRGASAAALVKDSGTTACLTSDAGMVAFLAAATSYTLTIGDRLTFRGMATTAYRVGFGEFSIDVTVGMTAATLRAAVLAATFTLSDIYLYPPGIKKYYGVHFNDTSNSYFNTTDFHTYTWYNEKYELTVESAGSLVQPIFKSGARYQVGVEYFDEYGRTNGTLTDDNCQVYIPTIGERGLADGDVINAGGSSIVVQISHTPPVWAKYFNIVWANTYKESICLTTTVLNAATVGNLTKLDIHSILLSNTNHDTSLTYTWQKGDRVRFITIDRAAGDDAGKTEWADIPYDAEIVSEDTNFASPDGHQSILIYAPAGMVLLDIEHSQIEIYRPAVSFAADEVLFHESTEMFDISGLLHEGTIPQTNTGIVSGVPYYGVWKVSASLFYIKLNISEMTSAIIAGDIITFAGDYTGDLTVINVTYSGDGVVYIYFATGLWAGTDTSKVGTLQYTAVGKPAVIYLDKGDAYLRPRSLTFAGVTEYSVYVESYSLSDYSDSEHYSIGRPSAVIDQSESNNIATIYYSEAFIPNTNINGLNRIYPDINFEEYNKSFGSIRYMHDEGDSILLMQDDKISKVMVEQSVMYDAQGGANYLGSENIVLSKAVPYAGEYGLQSPGSFAYFGNRKYWLDMNRGVVIRLSNDGISEISRAGLRGWFYDACKQSILGGDTATYAMYDPMNDEYSISFNLLQKTACYNEEINEGNGGWSSFLGQHFTGACSIDNKTFYISGVNILEINMDEIDVSRNAILSGGIESGIESYIKFSCNDNPAADKNFLAIAIDGNDAWDVTIDTEEGQQSHLTHDLDFRAKETEFQAAFLRDENTPNVTNPIFEGDRIRGKEASITLTLTSDRFGDEKYIKLVRVSISQG